MFRGLNNKAFIVGGYPRDILLGRTPNDMDFAVVATEQEFVDEHPRAQRVGSSFPVFLIKGNEVALTRTEKSNGQGYADFVVTGIGVPIEDDLLRRDLTINAIAMNYATGKMLDPCGGARDIKLKVIRAIGKDSFKEDGLRVYRAARFAAELDFIVEPATLRLMEQASETIAAIKAERVHAELRKLYSRSAQPSVFFRVLHHAGVLGIHFAPLEAASRVPAGPAEHHGGLSALDHMLNSFDYSKEKGFSFAVAMAALFHDTGKATTPREILPHHYGHEDRSADIISEFVRQTRFTREEKDLMIGFARNHMRLRILEKLKPTKLVRLYLSLRRRIDEYVQAANSDHELSPEQNRILALLHEAFSTAIIDRDVISGMTNKLLIQEYVERQYANKYRELLAGSYNLHIA